MNRGNIYASTADILANTNVEEVMKSAKKFATRLSNQDMVWFLFYTLNQPKIICQFGMFTFYALLPMGFLYTIIFPLAQWSEIYSNVFYFYFKLENVLLFRDGLFELFPCFFAYSMYTLMQ